MVSGPSMTEPPERPFFRVGKIALLLVVALLVYVTVVILWVPAGWVWAQASSDVDLPPGVQVQQVSGSLWNGAARLGIQHRPVRLTWHLTAPDVLELRQLVRATVETEGSEVAGDVALQWPASLAVDASGRIRVGEFEDLIRQSGGAVLEGDVIIERLRLAVSDGKLETATGIGRWPGGQVSWPMGGTRQTTVFPPMQAVLADSASGVILTVSEQGFAAPAAGARISLDGMMDLRVYRRLVDLAGQTWSASAAPGDVVFQVQQPLVPGGLL